jgi:ferredoxin-NADP reductase
MLQEFQNAIVTQIIDETHNTKRFFLQLENNFDFIPGQFITLDLPISDKKNKRLRSYSIASAPANNLLELVIVLLPEGAGTTYLFKEVKVGDSITLRGPQGHFVLPTNLPNHLYFVCTGTGIAPFRSMLHFMQNKKEYANTQFYLISGVRTQKDLLYHTEMENLQKQSKNFTYLPTLSRERWEGATGYVHEVYKQYCKGQVDAEFMLCGWRNMVDQARIELGTIGYDKKQIHFELYG